MTDRTHNTLVTLMIIVGVLIAILLLSGARFGRTVTYQYQYGQQANSLGAFDSSRESRTLYTPSYNQTTVTSYSRPSRYTSFGSTNTTITNKAQYRSETVYTYECSPDTGECWTNQ